MPRSLVRHGQRFLAVVLVLLPLLQLAPGPTAQAAGSTPPTNQPTPPGHSPAAPGHTPSAASSRPGLKEVGELVGLRTRTSRTYVTADGHDVAHIASGSVNYRDSRGRWQPIDNTLVGDTGSGGGLRNAANRYTAHLPADLAQPIRVEVGQQWLSFALVGAQGKAAASASTATYANAFPGVGVSYVAGSDSLKETLTLQSAAAPSRFVYRLQTSPGLTAQTDPQGGVRFTTSNGQVVFAFAPPTVADAASPLDVGHVGTLQLGRDSSGPIVTLAVNASWLASPARRFPVAIDPVVVIANYGTTDGGFIDSSDPTFPTCCGSSITTAGHYTAYSDTYRTLLQFDIAGSLPSNVQVLSAELGLFIYNDDGSTFTMNMHQVTTPWSTTYNGSSGVSWLDVHQGTWNSPGGDFVATPAASDANAGGPTANWNYWYPTQLVQSWVNGTAANDGLLLRAADETTTHWAEYYAPFGNSNYPYLKVVYVPALGLRAFTPIFGGALSDRMDLHVNLATGNLLLHATDLAVAGTGLSALVDRTYNSQSYRNNGTAAGNAELGNNWTLGTGDFVGLAQAYDQRSEVVTFPGDTSLFFASSDGVTFSAPSGIDATLVRNQDNSYTLTWQDSGIRWNFSGPFGTLGTIVDPNGNTLRLAYNSDSTPATLTDTQGRSTSFGYQTASPRNLLTTVTDTAGNRSYRYGYDANKNLTSSTDPSNHQTIYSYDSNFNLTQIQDPNGNLTQIAYAAFYPIAGNTSYVVYRVSSITDGANSNPDVHGTYTFTYNAGSTIVTDPNNHQTTDSYDAYGRLTQVTDAAGNTFQTTRTQDSHPATTTDALGHVTPYSYDANNNLTQVTLPPVAPLAGVTTMAVYGTVANIPGFFVPTSSTDAQGNVTSYGYDGNGNRTTVTNQLPSQNQTQTFYNANGTVNHVIDARGNTTSYGYDGNGNLTSITPPAPMQPTSIVPDALSRPGSVTDGLGQQRTYTYDPLDRVTALSYPAYPAGNVTTSFDADGNVLRGLSDNPLWG